jgi:hypothetical protein
VRSGSAVQYKWREEPSWFEVSISLELKALKLIKDVLICYVHHDRHKVIPAVAGIHYC